MIKTSDILDEKDKHLRAKNKDVTFPLTKERKKLIEDMLEHLYYSQVEKYAEKYNLRPGMGLAAPQLGINERFFVICHEETEGVFRNRCAPLRKAGPAAVLPSCRGQYRSFLLGGSGCFLLRRDALRRDRLLSARPPERSPGTFQL